MRAIKINVYKFNELSQSAKEKATNNYHDYFCFNDYDCDIIDYWLDKHNVKQYFQYKEAFYGGFYSQGDGAMFEYYNLEPKLIEEAIDSLDIKQLIKDIMNNYLCISARGKQSGHYYHEKSVNHNFDVNLELNYLAYPNLYKYIEMYIEDIENYIIDKYEALCGELYSMLKNEYEGLTSVESVEMFYNDNGMLFFKDGTVCNF